MLNTHGWWMFIEKLAVDNVPQPIEDDLAENFSRNRQKRDSPPVVAVSQISLLWNADYFTIFPILLDITSITDLVTETVHPRDNIATSPPKPPSCATVNSRGFIAFQGFDGLSDLLLRDVIGVNG